MFVIITDGLENSSREYSYSKISNLLAHQKKQYDWEFIFLGANIDAEKAAMDIGISRENAANYHADELGTQMTYAAVERAVGSFRKCKKLNSEWREDLDMDYIKRSQ